MPNSIILLNMKSDKMEAEVQLPVTELQAAWGNITNVEADFQWNDATQAKLRAYLQAHFQMESQEKRAWQVNLRTMKMLSTQNAINGVYKEIIAHFDLIPPANSDMRTFTLKYDAIVHQVVTHSILISIRHDWQTGVVEGDPVQIGTIQLDIPSGKVLPLKVNLAAGSAWTGFVKMLQLGMNHISEGTDHLLFLLVLLFPAPLLVENKRWGQFGGISYSLKRILQIITAFTIGHSFTLILGASGNIPFPSQLIEIAIAFSILVSAIHAFRPLFFKREALIAGTFGLIHGCAFATTLTDLQLETNQMVWSILGFNLGIELMQLCIMALLLPSFILWSQAQSYRHFRILGTFCAGMAALAWMIERITETPNFITQGIESLLPFSLWIILGVALAALFTWFRTTKNVA